MGARSRAAQREWQVLQDVPERCAAWQKKGGTTLQREALRGDLAAGNLWACQLQAAPHELARPAEPGVPRG